MPSSRTTARTRANEKSEASAERSCRPQMSARPGARPGPRPVTPTRAIADAVGTAASPPPFHRSPHACGKPRPCSVFTMVTTRQPRDRLVRARRSADPASFGEPHRLVQLAGVAARRHTTHDTAHTVRTYLASPASPTPQRLSKGTIKLNGVVGALSAGTKWTGSKKEGPNPGSNRGPRPF